MQALLPIAKGPEWAQAESPMHEPSATAAVLKKQESKPWRLFLAMVPSLLRHAAISVHARSPTLPSLLRHALGPWHACLAIFPALLMQALESRHAPSPTALLFIVQAERPTQPSFDTSPVLPRHALGPWQAPSPTKPWLDAHTPMLFTGSCGMPQAFLLMSPAFSKQAFSPTHAF